VVRLKHGIRIDKDVLTGEAACVLTRASMDAIATAGRDVKVNYDLHVLSGAII
jgi:hypothetical protein